MDKKRLLADVLTNIRENKVLKFGIIGAGSILALVAGFVTITMFLGEQKGAKSVKDTSIITAKTEKQELPFVDFQQEQKQSSQEERQPVQQVQTEALSQQSPPPQPQQPQPQPQSQSPPPKVQTPQTQVLHSPSQETRVTGSPATADEIYRLKQEKEKIAVLAEIAELEAKIAENKKKKDSHIPPVQKKSKYQDSTSVPSDAININPANPFPDVKQKVESEINKLKTLPPLQAPPPYREVAELKLTAVLAGVITPDIALIKTDSGVREIRVGEEYSGYRLESVGKSLAVFVGPAGRVVLYLQ